MYIEYDEVFLKKQKNVRILISLLQPAAYNAFAWKVSVITLHQLVHLQSLIEEIVPTKWCEISNEMQAMI